MRNSQRNDKKFCTNLGIFWAKDVKEFLSKLG